MMMAQQQQHLERISAMQKSMVEQQQHLQQQNQHQHDQQQELQFSSNYDMEKMLLAMAKERELLAMQLSDIRNGNRGLIREAKDDISTEPPASRIRASGGSMSITSGNNVSMPSQHTRDGVVETVDDNGSVLSGGLPLNGIPLHGDFAFVGAPSFDSLATTTIPFGYNAVPQSASFPTSSIISDGSMTPDDQSDLSDALSLLSIRQQQQQQP